MNIHTTKKSQYNAMRYLAKNNPNKYDLSIVKGKVSLSEKIDVVKRVLIDYADMAEVDVKTFEWKKLHTVIFWE